MFEVDNEAKVQIKSQNEFQLLHLKRLLVV